ncbi:anthranilate phosphoribosyltransferase [Thermodesulfomicrobium sp. WS]|uniref:anthranilate phosphoribosyltransferase n=1 Tax=Thermodesulfomicrobium sp. WS TaxID=3004129 RepID=UPI0024902E79|nr:anthranilate phosphoribosyltransferase [Thermodesulfomicrobium sp. WS]BDU99938.1 anthranilate phosphoribosyltransferase [Thermodesulfomicrobium sp. WS]
MSIAPILETLLAGHDLDFATASAVFADLLDGRLSEGQAAALLIALRSKGESATELAAAATAALARAHLVEGLPSPRMDTCGTGGDGRQSFNCSTAVALFLADMGYTIVKHGNRAVSSSCGSADIVEALGLPMAQDPHEVAAAARTDRFVFLFAPHFHPAFARIAPLRRALGVRTLFNLLGPLINPARPTHQILGVPEERLVPIMSAALAQIGVQHAAVVHGAGGFDELTPCGPGHVAWVQNGAVREEVIHPKSLGFEYFPPTSLSCTGKEDALDLQRRVLTGQGPAPLQAMVALNLGLALHLLEDLPLAEAMAKARTKVSQGILREVPHA